MAARMGCSGVSGVRSLVPRTRTPCTRSLGLNHLENIKYVPSPTTAERIDAPITFRQSISMADSYSNATVAYATKSHDQGADTIWSQFGFAVVRDVRFPRRRGASETPSAGPAEFGSESSCGVFRAGRPSWPGSAAPETRAAVSRRSVVRPERKCVSRDDKMRTGEVRDG